MTENKRSMLLRFLGYAIPILYAIPVLLVAYVLSIGPVNVFLSNPDGTMVQSQYKDQIISFYAPLQWCADNSIIFEKLIVGYIEIFVGKID